ncbi:hypothetical protein, partial [Deinococcus sp.]|uniref:hypothetical protein n=1 Tax=Deinococcus sp. TaxID=47478 RepID=UPI00286E6FA0
SPYAVPPGQVAIYGIFGEYESPNLLKTIGISNNPLAPKHVVLVRARRGADGRCSVRPYAGD